MRIIMFAFVPQKGAFVFFSDTIFAHIDIYHSRNTNFSCFMSLFGFTKTIHRNW